MTKPTATPATRRTPAQIAHDEVKRYQTKVTRLIDRAAGLRANLAETEHDLMLSQQLLDHAKANPLLGDLGADVAAGRGRGRGGES